MSIRNSRRNTTISRFALAPELKALYVVYLLLHGHPNSAVATFSHPHNQQFDIARVRGTSRAVPPPRAMREADAIPPNTNTSIDELRIARQPHCTAASLTNPSTQPRALVEHSYTCGPPPGSSHNNLCSADNTQAMDWSLKDADEI
jgi:hypothetical protein